MFIFKAAWFQSYNHKLIFIKTLLSLNDAVYLPKKKYSFYERFWLKRINDRRDLPFIKLLTLIHLLVLPVSVLLYTDWFKGAYWFYVAIPYVFISQVYFKVRFGLMLHCICHRNLFKKRYHWVFNYINWFVCPVFGHSPETYFSHHIGMHHHENNMADDSSSTLAYQRDNFTDFLIYFLNFLTLGVKKTFLYLYAHKKKKFYIRFIVGELLFYVFCVGICFVNLKATLLIFIFPFFLARLEMMIGNWTQHSFVDIMNPGNIFTNSIICINTRYNKTCWNDGYHAVHHLKPGLHYTEIPVEFLRLKEAFVKNKTLVFEGLGYLPIFFFLVTKQYNRLANYIVNIDYMFSTPEEVIALMRKRTMKINYKNIDAPNLSTRKNF